MTNYSPQKVAFAAASAAALATATAAAYYLYRIRRRDDQSQSEQSPVTLQPEGNSSECDVLPSAPRSAILVDSKNLIHTSQQSQPSETRSHSSPQVPRSPEQNRVASNNNAKETAIITSSFAWAVFWDIENVPVPRTISATHFVQALRKTLAAHRKQEHPDSILRIHAIANVRRASAQLRTQLQANGVNVTHVESKGRKDAADKALITEICLVTHEHPIPFGICLISGDGDFSYPVSRLTALGYSTVVVAPTRQSFSTLLEAVPDAVIPLRAVLDSRQDQPIEPQPQLRHAPPSRMPNQQTARHSLPTVPLLTPLSTPRRPDKRVPKKKRGEHISTPDTTVEREDDDCRSLSSDDDSPTVRMNQVRMSQRASQPYALAYTDYDSRTPANQVHRPYIGSIGNSRVAPQRLMPLPKERIRIRSGAQQKGDRLVLNNGHQDYRQPMHGSASHITNGTLRRTITTRNIDMDSVRATHLNQDDDRGAMVNGPRVRFAGDTINSDEDEKIQPRHDDPPEHRPSRSRSENSRRRNSRELRKQASSADNGNCSELPMRDAMQRLYYGTRLLPFVVLFVVLGFSLIFHFASCRSGVTARFA